MQPTIEIVDNRNAGRKGQKLIINLKDFDPKRDVRWSDHLAKQKEVEAKKEAEARKAAEAKKEAEAKADVPKRQSKARR